MTTQVVSRTDTAGDQTPARIKKVLFVTRDEEQLRGVDVALQEFSCEPQVADSILDALNSDLEQYLAVVLDESVVTERLSDVLDHFFGRAPGTSVLVACDPGSRRAIITTIATCAAEWISKPIDSEELIGRLCCVEQQRSIRAELEDSLYLIQRVADATPEMLYLAENGHASE